MPTNEQLYSFSKKYSKKRLSPLKSIRAYCKEQCSAGDMESWKNCQFTYCLLHRYRRGIGNRQSNEKHSSIADNSAKTEASTEQESSNEEV